ncbi:MAG TPA: hypothetical protein VIL22_08225, partial [Paenibacillaceae bacterium]
PDVKFSKSKLEILKVASSPRGDWKSARQLPSKTTIRGGICEHLKKEILYMGIAFLGTRLMKALLF